MMEEWRTYQISNLGNVVTGKTPPAARPEMFIGNVPFLTPTDMHDDRRYISTGRSVSTEWDPKRRMILPSNAICVVCIGATIGKVCMTLGASHTNQQVNSIIVDEKRFDPFFVYYVLRTKGDELKRRAAGAATPIINKSIFSEIAIEAPPLDTQRRIASILGAYDDLIEVNRRRVAVLEEMARGLFEEWFVRFRFPGHETVPILDTPDGPLPEGWCLFAFGDLLDVSIGGLWGEAELSGECSNRASVVRGTDFSKIKAGNFSTVPDRFVSSRELGGRLVQAGDIILEASGGGKDQPVGRVIFTTEVLIERLKAPVVPASFCRLIRTIRQFGLSEYAVGLLEQMYFDGRIEKFQKQSTGLRNFSMRQLSAESVILPPDQIIAAFGKLVRPWLELQSGYRNQIHVLAASRDLLLPRLISGQLSVARAERELEKVA